jgi:transposase
MQSTGVYWIAVQEVLEQAGLEVYLVNARGTKNLPGRKSDVQECQWLMKLHTYGLLANSFRPPEEIRMVRTIWRQRDRLVRDAGRAIQQIQKALTTMNIRLANAISDVSGVTGLAIIRAILKGERDPRELAKLRDPHIQASEEEVMRSLEGDWRDDVLFELKQGARYRRLRGRKGGKKAVKAMARYLACLVYRMLTKGQDYVDRGAAYFEKKRTEREMVGLQRKAAELGMRLVPVA